MTNVMTSYTYTTYVEGHELEFDLEVEEPNDVTRSFILAARSDRSLSLNTIIKHPQTNVGTYKKTR